MDIWQWVGTTLDSLKEQGHERLREVMAYLPSAVVDDEHERADALFHEGMALAKQQDNTWIEVYLRHWRLQSHVLKRQRVRELANEATDLLHFAHQPEQKDCPQSVCVVQDFAACFGIKDGLGYADERIAITEETLARINPSWACYQCISGEYLDAMTDKGQYDLVFEKLHAFREQAAEKGEKSHQDLLQTNELSILLKLGRYKEVIAKSKKMHSPEGGESFIRDIKIRRALAEAKLGKYKAAISTCIDFEEMLPTSKYYVYWAEMWFTIASAEAKYNTEVLNEQFLALTKVLTENGAVRQAIQLQDWQTQLSFFRNDVYAAKKSIAKIEPLIHELHVDMGASERLAELRAMLQTHTENTQKHLTVATLPNKVTESALFALSLGELEQLYTQIQIQTQEQEQTEKHPLYEKIARAFCRKLNQQGYGEEALGICHAYTKTQGYTSQWFLQHLHIALKYCQTEEIKTLTHLLDSRPAFLEKSALQQGYWLLINHHETKDKPTAYALTEKLLTDGIAPNNATYAPDDAPTATDLTTENVLKKAASLAYDLAKYQQQLHYLKQLYPISQNNKQLLADILLAARLCHDWTSVTDFCTANDICIKNEIFQQGEQALLAITPKKISENSELSWEKILIKVADTEGYEYYYNADCIAPMTAVITEVNPYTLYFGHQVIFHPTALNQRNKLNDQGEACDEDGETRACYQSIKTISAPSYQVFSIDGAEPDEAGWQKLLSLLDTYEATLAIQNFADYTVHDTQAENAIELPAVYAHVAVAENTDLHTLYTNLMALNAAFAHPLTFLNLAELTKNEAWIAEQTQLTERYNIY